MYSLLEIIKFIFPGLHGRGTPVSKRESDWQTIRVLESKGEAQGYNTYIIRDNIKYGRRRFGTTDWHFLVGEIASLRDISATENYLYFEWDIRILVGLYLTKRMLCFYFIIFIVIMLFDIGEDDDIWEFNDDIDVDSCLDRSVADSNGVFVIDDSEDADELDFDFYKNEEPDYYDEIRMDELCSTEGLDEFDTSEVIQFLELSVFFYNPILYNLNANNIMFHNNLINYFDYMVHNGTSINRYIDKRLWADFYLIMFDSFLVVNSNSQFLLLNLPGVYSKPFTTLEQNSLVDPDFCYDIVEQDLFGFNIIKPVNNLLFYQLEVTKLISILELINLSEMIISIDNIKILPKFSTDWEWSWN